LDASAGEENEQFGRTFFMQSQKILISVLFFFWWNCFSWELASVLRDSKSKFESAGVKLIAIGVGTPDKARILAERVIHFLDLISLPEVMIRNHHTLNCLELIGAKCCRKLPGHLRLSI
jgi:hypothetical protein